MTKIQIQLQIPFFEMRACFCVIDIRVQSQPLTRYLRLDSLCNLLHQWNCILIKIAVYINKMTLIMHTILLNTQ